MNVTSPASAAAIGGEQVLADRRARPPRSVVVAAPEPGREPGQAVRHRVPAVVRVGESRSARTSASVDRAVEHERPVGGQHQLGERAGEAAPRLDERHERARRQVEALERRGSRTGGPRGRASGRACCASTLVGRDGPRRLALGVQHPRADLGLVEAEVEDRVVELARSGERSTSRSPAASECRRSMAGAAIGRLDRDASGAEVAVELDVDVPVLDGVVADRAAQRWAGRCRAAVSGRSDVCAARASAPLAHELVEPVRGATASTSPHSTACSPLHALGLRGEHVGAGRGGRGACRPPGSARRCRAARRAAAPRAATPPRPGRRRARSRRRPAPARSRRRPAVPLTARRSTPGRSARSRPRCRCASRW